MAYYRAGWTQEHIHLLNSVNSRHHFWRQVSVNFIDLCVLEWCKLFAGKKDKHHWRNVVTDPETFKAKLLHCLGLEEGQF